MPDWRDPVMVDHYDVDDKISEPDFRRIVDGRVCAQCFTTYPERPGPGTTRLIMRLKRANWGRPDDEARDLLDNRACGVCAASMAAEDTHRYLTNRDPQAIT